MRLGRFRGASGGKESPGHWSYYPRFGFTPARQHGLECPFPCPDEAFMVLELEPGALAGVSGTLHLEPEFDEA